MKKLIILLLFIPIVSFGQKNVSKLEEVVIVGQGNIKNDAFVETTLETPSISPEFTINNPFLDCDINDNSCFQNLINYHILNNFYYPQLGNYFDIQAMVNVNYTIDKNGVVKNVSSNAALIGVGFEDTDSKKVISSAFEKAANSIIESLPKINPSIVDGITIDKKFRTPIFYKLVDIEKGSINSININKVNEGLSFLNKRKIEDLEIEVAYQGATIGIYGLDFDGTNFLLVSTHTDCLAKDTCGLPEEKQQVALSDLKPEAPACDPSSGCC